MAEALLRRRLHDRGIEAEVGSVGLLAPDRSAPKEVIATLADLGIDARDHRSRRLATEHVHRATMVLGMERQHVREVFVVDRSSWARTFTLKELVRRGEQTGGRKAGESLAAWLDRVHTGRRPSELLGESPVDDVEDPMGGDPWEYTRAAAEIDELLDRLVALAWPEGAEG
jgi:protein-tyrosine phosphatase